MANEYEGVILVDINSEGLAAAKKCREYAKDAPFEVDGFYELYETRCVEFKAEPPVPPGEDWDGVFIATTK